MRGAGVEGIRFRAATSEDCLLIFEWANDPATRANSATTAPIPWDGHVEWYERKLADPNAELWIALGDDGAPAGQVRFDVSGEEAEIGIMVDAARRGSGLGTRMIRAATADFRARRPDVASVVAHIRHHNVASQRAFARAGYVPAGEAQVRGVTMLRYLFTADSAQQ